MLNRWTEARAAAGCAAALAPGDAATSDTLGVVYSRLGEHERATAFFEQAVTAAPHNAGFQYNLAASLRFLGRFPAAERAYEAAIATSPDFHRAHSALSELRTQTAESNHIERLTGALARARSDVDAELHLRHALAKEHEDIGDYATAFEHLTAGKAAKRRTLAYSIDDDRVLFEALARLFDARRFANAAPGDPDDAPVFVVGMPRSGTTLVERILSSHSAVVSVGESQNFGLCLKRAVGTRSNRVLDVETLQSAMEIDFAALGRSYIEATKPGDATVPYFVDKMPLNFFYVGFIHLALPNARVICLRRDPMDTCLSNLRQLFALNFSYYNYAYDLRDIGRYYVLFDALIGHWNRVLPGKMLEVRYERLVADQEGETRRLLDFCGLPFEPACLNFHANTAPVATASAVQVRAPLYAGAIGRWRRYGDKLDGLRAELIGAGIALDSDPFE
jgi:tetratricopeptide (TPR) repeat protein